MHDFKLMTIQKHENYVIKLQEFLAANDGIEFAYGKNDCLTFTAKAVEAMAAQPVELFKEILDSNSYRSKSGAYKTLLKLGYESPIDLLDKNAVALDNPLFSQTGDIAIVQNEVGEYSTGIICGPFVFVPADGKGLVRISVMEIVKAYKWGI